uniref:Cytoplasmic dynein 1 intermediate chain 2-like isoform X4 n=1 Tax=Hirondellea gigas TaxID=1518452 RepID=A0A6A7FZX7_9CRUS
MSTTTRLFDRKKPPRESKEIAAKKKRLEFLRAKRKAKEEKQKADEKKKKSVKSRTPAKPRATAVEPTNVDSAANAADIQALLSSFQQITTTSPQRELGSISSSPRSDLSAGVSTPVHSSENAGASPASSVRPNRQINLGVCVQRPIDIVTREIPRYDRGVQTDADEIALRNAPSEEELQKKSSIEESERQRIKALEDRVQKAESELKRRIEEDEKRSERKESHREGLSSEEVTEVMSSKPFADFLQRASLHVERALTQHDVTKEYFPEDRSEQTDDQKESIVHRSLFRDKRRCSGRSVTSIDWSPLHPELFLTSYASSTDEVLSDSPDGLVIIWSLRLPSRPERVFTCQAAVLTAQFHPKNAHLIFGGTFSGQIVIWDTRRRDTPSIRTRFSNGHIHPVYWIALISSVQSRESLITISNDGTLCVWNDLLLIEPSIRIHLQIRRKEEVTTPAVGFPVRDPSQLVLGSDEGDLYKAKIYDEHPGIHATSQGHSGPITSIAFHPASKETPSEVANLFLTSSYDWTCKLRSNKMPTAMATFEFARAYVLDVKWSPVHPAVFAMSDASGVLSIWNLNEETELPVLTKTISSDKALSRIQWSRDGKQIAVGDSSGSVSVFDINQEVAIPGPDDALKFYHSIKNPKIFRDR